MLRTFAGANPRGLVLVDPSDTAQAASIAGRRSERYICRVNVAVVWLVCSCCFNGIHTPLTKHHAVGRGTARHGGAPASVGRKIAFGNTLEPLHRKILGTDARGSLADGPLNHHTGKGYVAEHRGDYYDALKVKKLKVIPLVSETMGGIGHPGRSFLGRLANMGDPKKSGTRDSTLYTCWTAPSFAAHHGMRISAEGVYADALILSQGAGAIRMKSARARV